MFWKRKKNPRGAEDERPAEKPISDEDAAKLADSALESIADLVRVFGEKSFDIEGVTASETQEACERWARHVMVGSPAHPSHKRLEAAGEPEAADETERPAKADDLEAGADDFEAGADDLESEADELGARNDASMRAGDTKPSVILRDFANLLRYFGSHRGREQGYVTESLSDLRMVIWNMVQNLRSSVSSDRDSDELATEQLRRLGVAVEGHSTEEIRREARECIRLIGSLIAEREARQKKQIKELGTRLLEMRSELEQAWEETTRDALTGLGNRAAFDKQIERVVDVGFLFSERAYLFMIDLDHFKWVNDRYGHPGGDKVLRQIAKCLRDSISRSTDYVSRYGGEEFAVLLRVTRKDLALQLAERVSIAVRDEVIRVNGEDVRVTVSLGVAELEPGEGSKSWLKRADAALYAAKDAGRDRYIFAEPIEALQPGATKRKPSLAGYRRGTRLPAYARLRRAARFACTRWVSAGDPPASLRAAAPRCALCLHSSLVDSGRWIDPAGIMRSAPRGYRPGLCVFQRCFGFSGGWTGPGLAYKPAER